MKNYYRVMLGRKSAFAEEGFAQGFVGADFEIPEDLTGKLPDEWRAFNKRFIPICLAGHPEKTKIGAGLACGALWTIGKGIRNGDMILSPDGTGSYRVGEVVGDYQYAPGLPLPHRRPVSKDKRELLVLELKKGRASDVVVGQILRYIGYAMQELAENGQRVKGVIIALEDDQKLRRALAASPDIAFYRYQVSFKLLKA